MIKEYFHHLTIEPAAHGLGMLRHRFSKPLYVLMSIAGLVLLMATANVEFALFGQYLDDWKQQYIWLSLGLRMLLAVGVIESMPDQALFSIIQGTAFENPLTLAAPASTTQSVEPSGESRASSGPSPVGLLNATLPSSASEPSVAIT